MLETMVIVDEAHIAGKPHQTGARHNVEMARWELVRRVAGKTPHLLLLTATPHNGYSDSFASLVRMVADDAVSGEAHNPHINRRRARRHVCQRMRRNIEDWLEDRGETSPFPARDQQEIHIELHPNLAKALDEVETYARMVIEHAGRRGKRAMVARWLAMHLQRRALSSPESLRQSLQNRLDAIERRLNAPEEDEASVDEKAVESSLFDRDPGEGTTEEQAVRRADMALLLEKHLLIKEQAPLKKLLAVAKKIRPAQDSKLQKLGDDLLPELLRQDRSVIVFTRYHDTLSYLENALPKLIGKEVTVLTMHGEMSEAQRREVFVRLERAAKCVLIATDVISEGINLQHAAAQVVHYELPWNPNRLEQRNGRVDRFGQPKPEVRIRTLYMNNWLDHAILELLVKKAQRIRAERGFAPPFWGDEKNILDLLRSQGRKLADTAGSQQLFLDKLYDDGDEADDETGFDDAVLDRVQQDSFYGDVDIQLPDVQSRLERSRKLIGSAEQIAQFVRQALSQYHCTVKEERDKSLTLLLPEPRLQIPGVGRQLKKATFDPAMALADPDLTVLDIGHPLVRRLIELVKEDFFREGATSGRTAALVIPDCREVTAHYRHLVRFTGGNDGAVLEEMVDLAFPVYRKNGLLSAALLEPLAAASPASRVPPPEETQPHFDAAWKHGNREIWLKAAIEERKRDLIHEREELRDRVVREARDDVDTSWLDGAGKLRAVSSDLLTATLYLPR